MSQIIEINQANLALKPYYLHDAKIGYIACDYYNHIVKMELDVSSVMGMNAKSAKLTFTGLKQFDMSSIEPWGAGIYIASFTLSSEDLLHYFQRYSEIWQKNSVKPFLHSLFRTQFQLNSGDEINIISEMLTLELIP